MVAQTSSGVQGSRRRHHALGVRGAVGVAALEAAAGDQHRQRPAPVIPAGVLVDLRRPVELAGTVDDGAVQQSPTVQILDQGRQGPVHRGSRLVLSE